MSLADLMRKGSLQRVAMATPATPATDRDQSARTVATVAGVAVANAPDCKAANDAAAPAATVDTVPTSAGAPDPDRWCWPHSDAMTTAEIDRFADRLAQFSAKGLTLADADALADTLTRRDRDGDDRRACLECAHLSGWAGRRQCRGLPHAGMGGPMAAAGQVAVLQRCNGFAPGRVQ